jgi:hypothetical protein
LTPVLVLDQFEEFFEFRAAEQRRKLIAGLAEVVKGNVPKGLRETGQIEGDDAYANTPPTLKVIIAMREDYVGQLDELSCASRRFWIIASG